MGWPILGENDTVASFTRDELRTYMDANYRAGSMLLVASGAVDHQSIVELATTKFATLRPGLTPVPLPANYEGGDIRASEDLEQAHVTFGFPGVSNADDEYYAAQIYVTALGGGMSSRLFQEAREKRGLCYSIYAFSHSAKDGGVIGVYAGTGEAEAAEIAAVVAGEMAALAETASASEIDRARAQLKSGLLMGLERPGSRAEQIAGQMFALERVLSVEEMVRRLDEVDASHIRRFGERLMNSPRPAVAALGPVGKLESYDVFAGRFGASAALRAAE
jgi:predicted Zn-dependent peptidase